MAVTLTGPIGTLLLKAKALVAASATMQTWLGVGDASAAEALIGHFWQDAPTGGEEYGDGYPVVTVDIVDSIKYNMNAEGAGGNYQLHGTVVVSFIDVFPEKVKQDFDAGTQEVNEMADAFAMFANNLGQVVEELTLIAGTDTHLCVNNFGTMGPDLGDESEKPRVMIGAIFMEF